MLATIGMATRRRRPRLVARQVLINWQNEPKDALMASMMKRMGGRERKAQEGERGERGRRGAVGRWDEENKRNEPQVD
jgi:hypothetical protein